MCELDSIPVDLLKQVLDGLLPRLTEIVNLAFGTATFAKSWEVALIEPLLKKTGLEDIKSNYRPVSNLSFLSKLVEKCALKRFTNNHQVVRPTTWCLIINQLIGITTVERQHN